LDGAPALRSVQEPQSWYAPEPPPVPPLVLDDAPPPLPDIPPPPLPLVEPDVASDVEPLVVDVVVVVVLWVLVSSDEHAPSSHAVAVMAPRPTANKNGDDRIAEPP
jgi:hypothetical protein